MELPSDTPDSSTPPMLSAVLQSEDGVVARVVAYPSDRMIWCGIWFRERLHLGHNQGELVALGDQTVVNDTIRIGSAADLIHFIKMDVIWSVSERHSPVHALVELLDATSRPLKVLRLSARSWPEPDHPHPAD